MPNELIRLRRPVEPIRHPRQVALLRAALERLGYTASDHDIQAAFSEWCKDFHAKAWVAIRPPGISQEQSATWAAEDDRAVTTLVDRKYLEPSE